ncbi:hypothetical protein BpHYR1_014008 [Brachionus plicatilis]|uniref:Uncharacterized protein n=1 Tax=Brachionus plicatilis TaxID=10195 RepID=A0A3M7QTP0_BRAPC|nr:hypothetical protein BpHYR1_014008 [Brachionus plicatilis]
MHALTDVFDALVIVFIRPFLKPCCIISIKDNSKFKSLIFIQKNKKACKNNNKISNRNFRLQNKKPIKY